MPRLLDWADRYQENTVFQDATRLLSGIPPTDGMHTIWTTPLGLNCGWYFLLTGRVLTTQQALDYGVASKALPRHALLPRAGELATTWADDSRATLRGTRAALTLERRRLLQEQLHTGLAHDAYAGAFTEAFDAPDIPIVNLDPRH